MILSHLMSNPFFNNTGPYRIDFLLKKIDLKIINKDINVTDIKDLFTASNGNITFFHSRKYSEFAKKTKASFCITNSSLKHLLPKSFIPIISDNILFTTSKITEIFYPDSVNDNFDDTVQNIEKTKYKEKVKLGKNILIGNNVKIGQNCSIGHNTIIEKNVEIGDNCSLGSNVIIRNSILKNNVHVLDGCVIGKKGFGFLPSQNKNIRYPQIGMVLIGDNCEIGCNSTIDRGSLSDTIIGRNTFLDNQIHIAHNVKIGDNCIIAGQVGFAGSSIIGDNVMIGGQAGVSGHLKIGNNVHIAGGSGVIKSISDNSKVMGYPAKELKKFLKDNK